MFGLFRKKPNPPSLAIILDMDDAGFVQTTLDSVKAGEPASGAMIAVAHVNLRPIMGAFANYAEKNNDPSLPRDVDGFIRMLADTHYDDEVNIRRTSWFFLAALIMRATALANKNREFENQAAEMWLCVADGCRFLKNNLQHNIIWSADEKIWFDTLKDEKDGVSYCLNHVMPKWLRENPAVVDYADKQDIFLSIF